MISNAIHRCLGAVLAFFKAERCPRINPSEIWELREIAARARAGFEALSSLENWPKIGTPFPSSGDDTAWEMELDPISPDFWVPFPRTRFSIGLPPLWLRLIEARHGVEERKGERTGATPPLFGVSPCPHPLFISHSCVRTRSPPGWGRSLVIYPCGKARTRT